MSDITLADVLQAVKEASIPIDHRWLDVDGVAAMLGYRPSYVANTIACRPDFPKGCRMDGKGRPRWLASEVQTWMKKRRAESA